MKERQLHILRHSIGLDDNGHGKEYRNHYCHPLKNGGEILLELMELQALSLMEFSHEINDGQDGIWRVTESGKRKAREGVVVKRLTRDQKRYQDFLNADSGLKFIEWLKAKRYDYQH